MRTTILLAALALSFCISAEVDAQRFGGIDQREVTGSAYHVFVNPGEAAIQVLVLGSVKNPGIYEIGNTIAMDHLLALAGGTSLGPENSKEVRKVSVRLLRSDGGRRVALYEAPLEQMLAEPQLYPHLQDGDVLAINATVRQKFSWSEALRVISTAASLYLAVDRLTRALK